jgi:hypothetical protein
MEVVSFIGGGNRITRENQTHRKEPSTTNSPSKIVTETKLITSAQ